MLVALPSKHHNCKQEVPYVLTSSNYNAEQTLANLCSVWCEELLDVRLGNGLRQIRGCILQFLSLNTQIKFD